MFNTTKSAKNVKNVKFKRKDSRAGLNVNQYKNWAITMAPPTIK